LSALCLNELSISSDDDRPIPVLTPQRQSPILPDSPIQQQDSPIPAVIQNTSNKPQFHIMEKLALCRKFRGYPCENGLVFLREFESFADNLSCSKFSFSSMTVGFANRIVHNWN
jgi:hypothetical protein